MNGSKLNKSQSKYYNTACLMDEALIRLLEKKSFEYITVKEICEKAGVNRSTFYLHYETIEDLLVECVEYVGRKITDKFSKEHKIDKQEIANSPKENLMLITPQYLIPYLEFVRENKAVFTAVASQPSVFKTIEISKYLFSELFEPILDRFDIPKNEQKYRMAFYLSGIHAVVTKWIVGGFKEDASYISNLIIQCIQT